MLLPQLSVVHADVKVVFIEFVRTAKDITHRPRRTLFAMMPWLERRVSRAWTPVMSATAIVEMMATVIFCHPS